ncbi:kinase [Lysobacter sp. Root916]|uniref:kinase n=1 Tax=Lysobacter sp. Root916 TaxID=1736606 RepID=UPI00070EDEE5|nr:kinase [Lysobacter sp. Root916]KRD34335.1 kinase [Lysobacter sp. Root916]
MPPATHPSAASAYAADFVERVLADALRHDARVYAIAGLQGSGKSTLAAQVAALAGERGLRVAVLSIDDCYLGRRERAQLGRRVHPLLATRGPPGTHEVELACATLDSLRAGGAARLPRFDKLGDRRLPPSRWPRLRAVDLTLFEGWFLKTPAQTGAELIEPINALERDEDRDGVWRGYCNQALAQDYPALWARLDRLLFLQPPGFEHVPEWRWQQERALQAASPGRAGMDRARIERFVRLFERVSRQALARLPEIADWTVPVDARRRVLA